MKRLFIALCLSLIMLGLVPLTGCRSAYYAAYEKIGVYKRDLLKKRVTEARDDQKEAQAQFKDALTRLKELTGFQGGNLEKTYDSLKGQYDDCAAQVETVHKRVKTVEQVADDLFAEWENEIGQINTPSLRDASRTELTETRARYNEMHLALKNAEDSMTPVLSQFHDYVLFLKHDLNAEAIASLKGETANIQGEINRLIGQMNSSIARADEFVKNFK